MFLDDIDATDDNAETLDELEPMPKGSHLDDDSRAFYDSFETLRAFDEPSDTE